MQMTIFNKPAIVTPHVCRLVKTIAEEYPEALDSHALFMEKVIKRIAPHLPEEYMEDIIEIARLSAYIDREVRRLKTSLHQ